MERKGFFYLANFRFFTVDIRRFHFNSVISLSEPLGCLSSGRGATEIISDGIRIRDRELTSRSCGPSSQRSVGRHSYRQGAAMIEKRS